MHFKPDSLLQVRQGNLCLEKIAELPHTASQKHQLLLLIHHQDPNYAHSIFGDAEVFRSNGQLYLDIRSQAVMRHMVINNLTQKEFQATSELQDLQLEKGIYQVMQSELYSLHIPTKVH